MFATVDAAVVGVDVVVLIRVTVFVAVAKKVKAAADGNKSSK